MLAGGVAFSACAILVALWFGSEKRDDELMMFKILISHFQLISIVASFPFSDNFRWVTDTLDFINFANHAGIEPVFVTTSTTSVEDFAELVECKCLYGDSSDLCAQQPCCGRCQRLISWMMT